MRRSSLIIAIGLSWFVAGAGCSDDTTTAKLDGSLADGRVGDTMPPGTDGPVGATTGPLKCQAYTTPAFSKSCTIKSDCVVVTHMIDCCGSMVSLGINSAEEATFTVEEQKCAATYPACGCPSQPTKTEDGSSLGFGGGTTTAAVDCLGGTCTTYVEACGKPCAAGSTCQSCTINAPSSFYTVCSTDCTTNADCKDAALPECVDDGVGAGFCAASGSGCSPK